MFRRPLSIAAAAVLLCNAPAAAEFTQEWDLCGLMSGFTGVCGGVSLSRDLGAVTPSGQYAYNLVLTNTGDSGLLTALALYSRSVEFNSWLTGPLPTGWQAGDQGVQGFGDNDNNGIKGFDFGVGTKKGVNNALKSETDTKNYGVPVHAGSLAFNFRTDHELETLSDLTVRWHAQSIGTNSKSYKCDSFYTDNSDYPCEFTDFEEPPITNVVPEPVTTVLLGTGLMSIAGAGLRRRRRGMDVVTE